jgi:hypothetical protein
MQCRLHIRECSERDTVPSPLAAESVAYIGLKKAYVMARSENTIPTKLTKVSTNPLIREYLEELVLTGLYGKNAAEAAERLVSQELRRLIDAGQLKPKRYGGD